MSFLGMSNKIKEITLLILSYVRSTGDLSSIPKTYFKLHEGTVKNNQMRRCLFPIAMTLRHYPPKFNEYDTVGIVVQVNVNTNDQQLWVADHMGR